LTFERPFFLACLFLLAPVFLGMLIHYARRRAVFGFFQGGTGPLPRKIKRRYWISSILFLAFFAAVVIALAGPRQGYVLVPETRRGIDAVIALDLSRSMDARDGGGPSRLERAADIARELVRGGGGASRYAAAIGKGTGMLALPLTADAEALLSFFAGVSTASLTGRGTNLEHLVDAASGAFKSGFPGKRFIVLFSDGEALQGSFSAALDRARAAHITIVAVGTGSEAGAPVPDGAAGEDAITRLERAVLENAARRTGGVYVDGMRDDAARVIRDALSTDASFRAETAGYRREARPVGHFFILAGVAAFAASRWAGKRPRDARARTPGGKR
jgi:Ca-activated chloride channel family protein